MGKRKMPGDDIQIEISNILKQNRNSFRVRKISTALKYWNYFDKEVKDKINEMETKRKRLISRIYSHIRSADIPYGRTTRRRLLDDLETLEDEITRYAEWSLKTRSRD